ncbi:hypothetical protein ABZ848_35475 [Streptomyces sp. NPDC047081]|uniref:hypothetical protein n=1 Tax=Streptomyces sp. NPDC047081 TaxID=3154706 RepID=UPI0033DAC403
MTITEKAELTGEGAPSLETEPVDAKDALQIFGGLLGLFALGAYTAQYWAIEEFYGQFDGLPPEYVGADKTVLLTRFSVTTFFLTVTLAVSLTPILLAYTAGEKAGRERPARTLLSPGRGEHGFVRRLLSRPRACRKLRRAASALPIGLWMGLCSTDLDPHTVYLFPFWMMVLLSWAIAGGILWMVRRISVIPARHKRWVTCLAVALLITAPAGFWTRDAMAYRGEQLAETGRVGAVEQWLGVRVQYVYAEFVHGEGLPKRQDGVYLHLGESGGVHVLYDCGDGRVQRVAAPQVQLTSRRDDRIAALVRTSCVRRLPTSVQRALVFGEGDVDAVRDGAAEGK